LNKFKSENINSKISNISSHQENKLEFKEYTTKNGIKCIFYRNTANPIVNVTIGYKVGSKDEPLGKKGIAHLFEHLMFQGSENVPGSDHFKYIQNAGGLCNAFTMQDATVYFDVVPSHQLEAVLWLESDRMRSLNFTEENVSNQKSVVIEEKKQRYDNAPYGTAIHNIFRMVMQGSNYESPVIGYEEDINSFSLKEAIEFHKTYYSPANSILVMTGDFEYDKAKELIEKYFGDIENSIEPPRFDNVISDLDGNIYSTVYDDVSLPVIYISYPIPGSGTPEEYTLEYFANIIANDKSSRLYKKLIYDERVAQSVYAIKYQLFDAGLFIFRIEVAPDSDLNKVENMIYDEIDSIINDGFHDKEYEKIRNGIEFSNTTSLSTLQNIGLETLFNKMHFDDIDLINRKVDYFLSYSKEDVINSVSKWFKDRNKFVLKYLPKEASQK
jgi:zinc protease